MAGRGPQTPTKPMGFIGVLRCQSLIFGGFHVKWWIFLEFPWKSRISMFSRHKVAKSWNRMPGWISRKAVKALCLVRFWGGYFRPGLDFSKITPFWWKWVEFHHISWKWGAFAPFSAPWGGNGALAAPERKHQRNLCFSYAFLGILGSKSAFRGGFPPKTPFRGWFWWNSPKRRGFRGNTPFWHNFQFFRDPRGSEPRKGLEFTCIIMGFARHAGDRRTH